MSGLLGDGNYDVPLEAEQPTILTGSNGTGKSTFLKTINAVGTASWRDLFELPFNSLALHFESAPTLRVKKVDSGIEIRSGRRPPYNLPSFDEEQETWIRRRVPQRDAFRNLTFHELSDLTREETMRLSLTQRRQVDRYRQLTADWWENLRETYPAWMQEIPDRFPVRFITEQRLIIQQVDPRSADPRYTGREASEERIAEAVSQYSSDLARLMTRQLRLYAAASQREDRFFPQNVVQAMREPGEIKERDLQDLLKKVVDRRQALEEVGLVEEEAAEGFDERSLENAQVRHVIKAHAEATLRKFNDLEELRTKLELFRRFLNEHFVGKRVRTRADEGLSFVLKNGDLLRPSRLSSGEQQMLVLAYQLLFETPRGTLLLIDEPEISLHVGWQRTFVDDITAMGRPQGINFLLATHSPTLIGGREELKRSLDRSRK